MWINVHSIGWQFIHLLHVHVEYRFLILNRRTLMLGSAVTKAQSKTILDYLNTIYLIFNDLKLIHYLKHLQSTCKLIVSIQVRMLCQSPFVNVQKMRQQSFSYLILSLTKTGWALTQGLSLSVYVLDIYRYMSNVLFMCTIHIEDYYRAILYAHIHADYRKIPIQIAQSDSDN